MKPVEPDRDEGAVRVETTTLKLVEPGREERATRVETPGTRTTNPTQVPGQSHHGFDTTHSLPLAGRLNQLRYFKPVEPGREYPYPKLVEPGRDEGAVSVETTTLKLVEPGREERATRVETKPRLSREFFSKPLPPENRPG